MLQLLSFRAGGLFSETNYCIILSYYFQLHAEVLQSIGVLKTLYTIHRKTTVSESLFNQPVACCFFNNWLRRFLADIAKLSRTPFLQEHLVTPDSVFMEHVFNYIIIHFNVNCPKRLFQPFETLIKIEMYTCEIKITWTWEIILFLLFWY